MQNLLIPAGILFTLLILAVMCHMAMRKPRNPEVTSTDPAVLAQLAGLPLNPFPDAPLFTRVKSAVMRDIVQAAGSLDREELVQAAMRGGRCREVAEAYADEIVLLCDPGEELPAALAHAPNLGGEGHPDYAGPNYVSREDMVDELRGLIRYSGTGRGE